MEEFVKSTVSGAQPLVGFPENDAIVWPSAFMKMTERKNAVIKFKTAFLLFLLSDLTVIYVKVYRILVGF